jgi:hypothetical protein
VFDWLPNLQNIGYLVNEGCVIDQPLADLKLKNHQNEESNRKQKVSGKDTRYFQQAVAKKGAKRSLWISSRKNFTKPLKIRKSRIEDSDDLVPMLMKQNSVIL